MEVQYLWILLVIIDYFTTITVPMYKDMDISCLNQQGMYVVNLTNYPFHNN